MEITPVGREAHAIGQQEARVAVRRTWKEAPLGRPRRRQRRNTVADAEFGISGDLSGFPFGCATVCAHMAHVAPERGETPVLPGRASGDQGAPVLWTSFCESTGGKLGVPQRPRYRKFG